MSKSNYVPLPQGVRMKTKQGTEWTEPGRGATVEQIGLAMNRSDHRLRLYRKMFKRHGDTSAFHVTNLRLTGEPLTAEDLQRIATCK